VVLPPMTFDLPCPLVFLLGAHHGLQLVTEVSELALQFPMVVMLFFCDHTLVHLQCFLTSAWEERRRRGGRRGKRKGERRRKEKKEEGGKERGEERGKEREGEGGKGE